jgi:hypothetical protein
MAAGSQGGAGWARYYYPAGSIEVVREVLDAAPAPIVEIDVVLAEDDQTVMVYYRIGDNWDGIGFMLPAPIDPEEFRGAYFAELLTAPRLLH